MDQLKELFRALTPHCFVVEQRHPPKVDHLLAGAPLNRDSPVRFVGGAPAATAPTVRRRPRDLGPSPGLGGGAWAEARWLAVTGMRICLRGRRPPRDLPSPSQRAAT